MMPPVAHIAPEPELMKFGPDGGVPNNPDLPVLVLRAALRPGSPASDIRATFEGNGWGGTWTWSVFPYHHFHPDAHEVLAVAQGWGEILVGGPSGVRLRVDPGDVVVLPAGTGHCRMAASPDFAVCGGYPPDQLGYTTLRAGEGDATLAAQIAAVARPDTDPVFGPGGPLIAAWTL